MTAASACGSVAFSRADGAHKYGKLPRGAQVAFTTDAATLPQPVQQLGSIEFTIDPEAQAADEASVKGLFSRQAARYGCDAVVGLSRTVIEKKGTKRRKVTGPNGEVTYEKVTIGVPAHRWTAHCVRTAAAPGGLVGVAPRTAAPATAPATAPPAPGAAPTTKPAAPEYHVPPPRITTPPPAAKKAPEPTRRPAVKAANSGKALALWARLYDYRSTYLRGHASALEKPAPSTLAALRALGHVMQAVAGERGFWRQAVPTKWFGCKADPQSDACRSLKLANRKVVRWYSMRGEIAGLTEGTARAWLEDNQHRVDAFLTDFVPRKPTLAGAKKTPFFARHFLL